MKKNILVWLAFLATALVITSCLKDNTAIDWSSGAGKVYVEFSNPNPGTTQTLGILAVPDAQTCTVQIDITTLTPASKDIPITIGIDTTAMNAYNEAKFAKDSTFVFYQAYPIADVSIPSTVTIKAGHTTVWFTVAITNADQVDVFTKWMVPIVIKDASGLLLTANKSAYLLTPTIKNKYDGVYTVTGTMVDNANGGLTGNYPVDFELITQGPGTCTVQDDAIGGIYHSIRNGTALSYYGAFGLVVNFNLDGSGQIINVQNYWAPAANTRDAVLDPSGVNAWDPSTHNIQIKYFMIQPSLGYNDASNPRTTFDETWTYQGSR